MAQNSTIGEDYSGSSQKRKRSDDIQEARVQLGDGSIPKRCALDKRPQTDQTAGLNDLLQEALEEKEKLEYLLEEQNRKVKELQQKLENSESVVINSDTAGSDTMEDVDSTEVLLEGPFQFDELSFMTNDDQLVSTNNSVSLIKQMSEFRKCGLFCDVEVTGRGSISGLSCHSVVLCALSSVIKTRFCSSLHSGSSLHFKNIPHNTLVRIVDFAYNGEIELNEQNVLSVYTAADFLDIEFLIDLALEFLSNKAEKFDGVSCYKLLSFVDQHRKLQPLIAIYKRRVIECAGDVFGSIECLNDLSFSMMVEVLECDYANCGPEIDVLRALDRWIALDPKREQHVHELLSRIQWDQIEACQILQLSETVKACGNALKSASETRETDQLTDLDCPKIGSRSSGLQPLLLDMETRKMKLLPELPYGGYYSVSSVIESDDGFFYAVMRNSHDDVYVYFRLNLGRFCWDRIFCSAGTIFISGAVLNGMLCLVFAKWGMVHIKCLNMSTRKDEFFGSLPLRDFHSAAVSISSSSISILHTDGKLSRISPKDDSIHEIMTDLPPLQNTEPYPRHAIDEEYGRLHTNGSDLAVVRVNRMGYCLCLKTGRVIRSFKHEGFHNLYLLHDSVLYTKDGRDKDLKETKTLTVYRDGLDGAGWNEMGSFSWLEQSPSVLPCHFARGIPAVLADYK